MLVWLLVLLLLFSSVYVVYRLDYSPYREETFEDSEQSYTFKL